MSTVAPVGRRPGRGLIIAGIVVLVLSVVAAVVGVVVFGGSVDLDSVSRDVAVESPAVVSVPGEVRFRILEPLRNSDDTMSVAVGLADSVFDPDCQFTDDAGEAIPARRATLNDSWVDPTLEDDYSPFIVADDLRPGDYEVSCTATGEPSTRQDTFTVGRVLTVEEVFDVVEPVFGVLGTIFGSGLIGFVGLILLIIGLVRSSRAKRPPTGWQGPPGGYGPPQGYGPPGGYGPPHGYGPPPGPPGGHGSPPAPPPAPPPATGPVPGLPPDGSSGDAGPPPPQ